MAVVAGEAQVWTVPHRCMCGQQTFTVVLPACCVVPSCLTTNGSPPLASEGMVEQACQSFQEMCSWPSPDVRAEVTQLHQWSGLRGQNERTGDQLLPPRWPRADGAEKLG